MLGSESLQRNLQFHRCISVDGNKLIVLQFDNISVDPGNDSGYTAKLAGLVGKKYGDRKNSVP